jgi:hypothetical protein
MKQITYYWFASLAYVRGWLYTVGWMRWFCHPNRECCVTGLNGKGEAMDMFVRHNWIPYSYRRIKGCNGFSRAFITDKRA